MQGHGDTDNFDLSNLRGAAAHIGDSKQCPDDSGDDDLNALAELVPDVRTRKNSLEHTHSNGMTMGEDHLPLGGGLDDGPHLKATGDPINHVDSMGVHAGITDDEKLKIMPRASYVEGVLDSSSSSGFGGRDVNDVLAGHDELKEDVDSDEALSSDHSKPRPPDQVSETLELGGDFQNISSAQSLSTATQTHEVRMPMYLPTFKPATGCTNASDFIVRCFVARLRSGITVVKHGRSRWCKSRLRILHIHPDGRSLSWKPAQGEPTSSKRPPKLDLTTCLEVRHAWSPDPQNPMYTGTPILRQKCEAANAHKSFALIFPKRTVDITSVTADQCKVLMEGFSALCFRLQVANLAGKGGKKGAQKMPEEEEVATTASVTLTNNSTLSPHNRR
jgi:hypothetical protein